MREHVRQNAAPRNDQLSVDVQHHPCQCLFHRPPQHALEHMNAIDREIRNIELWLDQSGMRPSRLGLLACANSAAIDRMRNGTGSIETLRRLVEYVSAHQPHKTITRRE